ncbi:MAG TPA: hypothetical protein VK053_06720 [Jiangellaceae bacterium]|nr:hypothetical protein [Jiangellaceae bacterium]
MNEQEVTVVVAEEGQRYTFASEADVERWAVLGEATYTKVEPASEGEIAESVRATTRHADG